MFVVATVIPEITLHRGNEGKEAKKARRPGRLLNCTWADDNPSASEGGTDHLAAAPSSSLPDLEQFCLRQRQISRDPSLWLPGLGLQPQNLPSLLAVWTGTAREEARSLSA